MARPKINDPEVRANILAAAERLFADRGYDGTAVRGIAEAANVTGAMVHYYFGSKEALYHAVIETAATTVRSLMLETTSGTDSIEQKLSRFVEGYADYLFSHPHLARILHRELLAGGNHLKEIIQYPLANYTILREALAGGVRSGELRRIDLDLAPISLMGMLIVFQLIHPVLSSVTGATTDKKAVKRLAAHTVDLFLNGAKAALSAKTKKSAEVRTKVGRRTRVKP
jgi:AcrR family transcriptional regulator